MPNTTSSLVDQILSRGYGTVHLGPAGGERLASLYQESSWFFAQDTPDKLSYSVPNRISGYRPFSYANTSTDGNEKPDLNDSFLYWPRRRTALPNHEKIGKFLDAAEAYRLIAAEVVEDVVKGLCEHYDYRDELTFEDASVLQINSFVRPVEAELYQYSHEDADLLTVIWGSDPGLEAVFKGGEEVVPISFGPDEVLVMPGSILTVMTGDEIQPFFHQVRNHNIRDRKSIMYFVCPDAEKPIAPFQVNEHNKDVDIQRLVLENPQMHFGLSEDFVSA